MTDQPTLSNDSLLLFKELMEQLQLPVSHPDFERQAARLVTAQKEITAALEAPAQDMSGTEQLAPTPHAHDEGIDPQADAVCD